MTTKSLIRNRAKQKMDKIPVYIRVRDGSIFDQWQPLPLLVKPEYWDAKQQGLKTRVLLPEDYRKDFSDQLTAIRIYVEDAYYADAKTGKVDNTWLKRTIQEYCKHGGKKEPRDKVLSLSILFNEFLKARDLSENRKKQYAVIYRTLCRYELFMRVDRKKRSYRLDIKKVDKKQLEDIYTFIKNEHLHYEKYKEEIYDKIPDKKNPPHPRGHNTMFDLMKKLRAFFNWCVEAGYITESPFKGFHIEPEIYGTPTYLLKSEVHQLNAFDFFTIPGISEDRAKFLSTQRDIIVFQCNIGPRVSDLLRFGSANVISGAIEYIPGKTRKSSGRTVVVPMNETARRIYERYQTSSGNTLLPTNQGIEDSSAFCISYIKDLILNSFGELYKGQSVDMNCPAAPNNCVGIKVKATQFESESYCIVIGAKLDFLYCIPHPIALYHCNKPVDKVFIPQQREDKASFILDLSKDSSFDDKDQQYKDAVINKIKEPNNLIFLHPDWEPKE